ncbi:hypothetical protein DUNSADRAFT_4404 [Dunaliella salina]|uniref:Uncharacterized protein n=1 Tax=Dunaliella salina TaxID=3046 RepID=A0ABQ7GS40_DUNSA|nr:hypothetical protein DUNSADRAFT_4404 [Dunaliella salina]|eukprot:KAF5837424.1 hypothetical protein DUNSADRAFT_4404 [Dunaliella salina]
MVPELRVRTFTREGGKPVQQQDFSVPASAPPPPPPPKRDPYQQFIDDDTTKRTTSVPLKFLQPAHGSSSSTSGVHPNLTAPRDVTSAPSKARPGHTLADAVLEQQAGLGVTAMDQDATALVWDSPQQRTSRMVLPGVVAPAEGGANGGVSASKGHSTVSGEHNIASEDPSTGGTSASKVHNTASEEHNAAGTAGLVDTQVVRRDRTEVVAGGLGCTVSADDVEGGGATGSLAADLGAGPPQSNLRQHTPGSAVDSCVSGRGAGLQQVAASQRVPGMGVPASSAQGQSRREIFHRQAKLAAQMQRMGMPPLLEWGSSRVKVGKAVAPGLHTNMGTGSDAHFPPHKISSQQVQQRQGNRVQRSRPMSGKLQQQKEEQEQQQEDERRAQHQQAQQARHAQQGQGLADYGNKGSPQAPVHAWRLEWEARKQRAALNGPAVQRARKMKAQMAKERAQREDLSNLAAEYEAAYQGMGRVEGEHFTALDGFSHTLLQSVHPHTPGTPHHKATAPSNEVEGGSRACLKPVGIDMHAWQQAHERLDAYKREQALKQKRNADQRKPAKQDARLERLAKLLAAVQKEGGTLGIDVPRQEPPGEEPERASGVEGSHQELGCRVSVGAREPGWLARYSLNG